MKLPEIKEKHTIAQLFLCFMMYAVIGWCYEVVLETFIYRWGFSNRGVLFGPYCPVYGVGALTFLFCFGKLMRKPQPDLLRKLIVKPLVIFLGCMAVATLIELAASYLLEALTGAWPWQTYKDYKVNFQGRIALPTSLRFGLGGLLFLYIVQPLFDLLLDKPSNKALNRTAAAVLVIVAADAVYTVFFR